MYGKRLSPAEVADLREYFILAYKIAVSLNGAATASSAGKARRAVLLFKLEALEALVELGQLAAGIHQPVHARPRGMGLGVDVQA